jgi:hypothetical protein
MVLAIDIRRQTLVCARLAQDCDDPRLANRFRKMATDLLSKADYFEDLANEQVTHQEQNWFRFSFEHGPRYGHA